MDQEALSVKQLGRIGVLMGGCSSEWEISLKSGKAVLHALEDAGCDVVAVELNTIEESEILAQLFAAKVDLVFLVLHGRFGEDGTIQSILSKAGISYTGSEPLASRLAMDKVATQILLKKSGIRVPDFFILDAKEQDSALSYLKSLGGCPVVVKPSCEGSSIGITIVFDEKDFLPALAKAFELGPQILVERYILGKEITSGVLGGQALPLVEIRPKSEFFDFTAKYQKGMSDYIVPAEIEAGLALNIQAMSQKVFNLVGCRDMARSDFILDEKGQAFFLEINTIPGFTATSLLPMAAQAQGITFADLCLSIVRFAAQRKNCMPLSQKAI